MHRGFSLVELSIVLVILGLLTGGILAGQSLIRASELRAVTTEYNRYTTAVQAFRDKYFAIPGDFSNATGIWGKSTNCSGTVATGTCDGNGNGILSATAAGATSEIFQFWNQLALAGLIEGSYSGLTGAGGLWESLPGTNVPNSKLSGASWSVMYFANYVGDGGAYAFNYQHFFSFGAYRAGNINNNPILKTEEAWNIDTKLDDGMPASGKIVAYNWTTCTTSTANNDYTGTYKLNATGARCALWAAHSF